MGPWHHGVTLAGSAAPSILHVQNAPCQPSTDKAQLNFPGFVFPFSQLCLCKSLGMDISGMHPSPRRDDHNDDAWGLCQQFVTLGMVETGKVKHPLGAIRGDDALAGRCPISPGHCSHMTPSLVM